MTRRPEQSDGTIPLSPGERARLLLHPDAGEHAALDDPGLVRQLARELPDPSTLDAGSWVAVGAGPAEPRRRFGLFGGRRPRGIPLAIRCTALLARGYTDVCADESGTAFGRVPG